MRSVFEWVITNKEWLFSGVGIIVLIAIFRRRTDLTKVAKKALRRPVLTDQVRLLLQSATVRVDRADEGVATFGLWLVNLSTKNITVDRVVLDGWSWLSYQLPELVPAVRGLGTVVPRQSIGYLHLSIQLNAAAIRRIAEATPKDLRQLTQGNLALYASGTFHLKEAKHAISYQLEARTPQCSFYWLQQQDAGAAPSRAV